MASPAMSALLTIGEVARRSGVAASALRFYEERGLITSERAGSGHRRYPRPVLRRIAFIVFAQRIGLTLDEIGAELARLPPERAPTAATGRASRAAGQRGSISASPSSSASSSGLTNASAAAACRSTAAGSPTPTTGRPASARVRATGSATARRTDARTRSADLPTTARSNSGAAGPGRRVRRSHSPARPPFASMIRADATLASRQVTSTRSMPRRRHSTSARARIRLP